MLCRFSVISTLILGLLLDPTLFAVSSLQSDKHDLSAQGSEIPEVAIFMHADEQIYEVDTLLVDQGDVYGLPSHIRCPEFRKTLNPKNTCHISFTSVAKS